jgi:hypothetical protein
MQKRPFRPLLLLSALSLVCCGSVMAQSTMAPASTTPTYQGNTMGMGDPGSTYFSINAGVADLARPISGFGNFGSGNQSSAYSLNVGHYLQGQNFGFELGYTDFGSIDKNGGHTKVDGWNASVIGRLALTPMFNLLGKVGTTYGRTDVTASAGSLVVPGTEKAFDWSYGIGGELLLTPNWSATLTYDEHYMKYPPDSHERVSSTMIGARYRY